MKHILRIDSTGGASGDMLLGMLADLGADLESIQTHLRALLPDTFAISLDHVQPGGIRGSRVTVSLNARPHSPRQDAQKSHSHEHAGPEAGHSHPHTHPHGQGPYSSHVHAHHHEDPAESQHPPHEAHSHVHAEDGGHAPQRGLNEIRALLEKSDKLPSSAVQTALAVFERLARAEASVHGIPPEKVHFHEVGAVDAIVDILGCCLALEQLEVGSVQVGPLPIGQGTLRCQHGVMPIPAPATLRLLEGHPVTPSGEPFELVTPTGAALLMEWKTLAPPPPPWKPVRSGFGFGQRDLNDRPNLIRGTLLCATRNDSEDIGRRGESLDVLETNLDDCPAEWIGALFDRLPPLGALDIWTTPAGMKKSRPGVTVNVLCRPENSEPLTRILFQELPTLGIRIRQVRRVALERDSSEVATEYGAVRIKRGRLDGETLTQAPEFEDCVTRAAENSVSPRRVYDAACVAAGI